MTVHNDLFYAEAAANRRTEPLTEGAVVLRGFALDCDDALLEAITQVSKVAPFRHLITPGGHTMSVAMSNCGTLGWVSDRRGYRYSPRDPQTGKPWPGLPEVFARLCADAALAAGFAPFTPDACLINRYEPGARLTLHQDRDELDLSAPVVSVSLGLPATFLFGGMSRSDRPMRVPVYHGDVAVWGGVARLSYHGIAALPDGRHEKTGALRFNLTFRKVD